MDQATEKPAASNATTTLERNAFIAVERHAERKSKTMTVINDTSVYPKGMVVESPQCGFSHRTWSRPKLVGDLLSSNVQEDFYLYGTFCFPVQENCAQRQDGWMACQMDEYVCRDCGVDCHYTNWTDCPLVVPRPNRTCTKKTTAIWDSPRPRVQSMTPQGSSVSNSYVHILSGLRWGGHMKQQYEQLACQRLEDCWDLTQCQQQEHKLTIYPHGNSSLAAQLTALAVSKHPHLFVREHDPEKACLLLVTCDSFASQDDMFNHPNWNLGQNHFVWRAGRCFGNFEDLPFILNTNYQKAALGAVGHTDANIRMGYDTRLAYKQGKSWQLEDSLLHSPLLRAHQDLHNESSNNDADSWYRIQRPYLVTFKGNVQTNWIQPYYAHRWLAYSYWEEAPDIVADVNCQPDKSASYKVPADQYFQLLLNSTFVFCAGGNGPGSYRLGETLATGGIPILPAQLLPPFTPEVTWDACILRVHEGRIADLPRMLRKIPREEIIARRKRCAFLFSKTMGWGKVHPVSAMATLDFSGGEEVEDAQHFLTAMKIWRIRMEHATTMNPFSAR